MTSIRFVLALMALGILQSITLSAEEAKPNTLTTKEIEEGWILLFDGETTFGWKTEGEVAVKDGKLIVGGQKASSITTSSTFAHSSIDVGYIRAGDAWVSILDQKVEFHPNDPRSELCLMKIRPIRTEKVLHNEIRCFRANREIGAIGISGGSPDKEILRTGTVKFEVAAGASLILDSIKIKPFAAKPLFNAKDLTGWKIFEDPKRNQSKWSVTKEGWLNVKNGPGDLQTEGKYGDFVLQLECISNGKALNSGVFFRCIANEYQNGYEMQIQNGFKDNDRTKPSDFGTGAIYRRVPARKVVPNDNEWFSMTLAANGNHISTWVNGYQTVDWTDDRKADDNPRKGSRTAAGHLSIQGHDPTTDLSFRNLRIVELKSEKK